MYVHCTAMPGQRAGSGVGKFNAGSPKQDSKRFNCQGRRNTLPIWVWLIYGYQYIWIIVCMSRMEWLQRYRWGLHICQTYTVGSAPSVTGSVFMHRYADYIFYNESIYLTVCRKITDISEYIRDYCIQTSNSLLE